MNFALKDRVVVAYPSLSAKLKQAADFVLENPVDVATRSLRSIANDAGLAPATFSRMSRAVGFDDYEQLREQMRSSVNQRANTISEGLTKLQNEHGNGRDDFFLSHLAACSQNLESIGLNIQADELERAAERLHASRKVIVSGAMGSTGAAEYLSYMADFITDKWSLTGRMGASLGSSLMGLGEQDTLIVVTKPPFAAISIHAAEVARAQGAHVIIITNTYTCPALAFASSHFVVATQSPNFFSSYVATIALMESIVGTLAARAGISAKERIAKVEESNRHLEYL